MRLSRLTLIVAAATFAISERVEAQGSCSTYPLVWTAPTNAEANAYSDLASISNPSLPEPLMYWSTPRGTFTTLASLDYVFPSCTSLVTAYVSAKFFALAGTVPNLLPLTSGEWTPVNDLQCQNVPSFWRT